LNKHHRTGKRRRRQAAIADDPRYHSGAEFARRLGVSRVTVWRLMRQGRLRFIRISPTLVRIPVTEYERLGDEYRRATACKTP
jgi:excisionase family DNA binding protein